MKLSFPRLFAVMPLAALLSSFVSGCAPHEDLIVPAQSAMLQKIPVRRDYVLQWPTVMAAMKTGDVQPEIHLPYDIKKDGPPPAEAFERVQFAVTAEEEVLETDPNNPTGPDIEVTEPLAADWGALTLGVGTEISVSFVEVYANSHVYHGRIRSGTARNTFILLVVPAPQTALLTVTDLQEQDRGYLLCIHPASTTASTRP
jgi:hypothetical protein